MEDVKRADPTGDLYYVPKVMMESNPLENNIHELQVGTPESNTLKNSNMKIVTLFKKR